MPEFKQKIDGKDVVVEVSKEDILSALGKDTDFLASVAKMNGIDIEKMAKEAEEAKKKRESASASSGDQHSEIAELKQMIQQMQNDAKAKEAESAKAQNLEKRNSVLDKAVADGKIAKDDVVKYDKIQDAEVLGLVFDAIQPSPALLKNQQRTEDGGAGGVGGGASSFTRKQIDEMSEEEFVKNLDAINAAQKAGNVV